MEEVSKEFEVRDALKEKRKDIKTLEDLTAFIKDVEENYNIGYGEAPRAMAQAVLATAWYLCDKMGLTGFQAGFVMWDFVRDWMFSNNKCGLKIIDYDELLYPQYYDKYEKTISDETWIALQNEAKRNLKEKDYASVTVKEHWQSIADGKIPFGYKLQN